MHVCLILFPGFPMLGHVLVQEVLRLANACAGQALFTCRLHGVTGVPVTASDGTQVAVEPGDWASAPGFDLIVLCAGPEGASHLPMGLRGFLVRGAAAGACLAGLDEGARLLARLGFLDGHSAVLPACAEDAFADVARVEADHVLDRQRLTARGGLAVAEAMIAWISRVRDARLAAATARALAHGRVQDSAARLHLAGAEDPVLARMQALMAAHLDKPLPLPRIAAELELSAKQLRLRCHRGLGLTPQQAYLALRLKRAAQLVEGTRLSVEEIARATGFRSASAFTRSYRRQHGVAPRAARKTNTEPRAARKADPAPRAAQPGEMIPRTEQQTGTAQGNEMAAPERTERAGPPSAPDWTEATRAAAPTGARRSRQAG